MCSHLKNNPNRCNPDLIWNDGVLGFCEEQEEQQDV